MRTDAKIDRYSVTCPNASQLGYHKVKAEFGDIVVYRERFQDGNDPPRVGRVAGRVHYAPALEPNEEPIEDYLLVIVLADDLSFCFERWINPTDVVSVHSPSHPDRKLAELRTFFISPEFRQYSPAQLREWSASGYATPELAQLERSSETNSSAARTKRH
jgi:hypothetical protein